VKKILTNKTVSLCKALAAAGRRSASSYGNISGWFDSMHVDSELGQVSE
jgi:hypothetical protein